LFWLTVSEVSVHNQLALVLWGLYQDSKSWGSCVAEQSPHLMVREMKKRAKKLETYNPLQRHASNHLRPSTLSYLLKFLPPPNSAKLQNTCTFGGTFQIQTTAFFPWPPKSHVHLTMSNAYSWSPRALKS
jgi:hypothetical protein